MGVEERYSSRKNLAVGTTLSPFDLSTALCDWSVASPSPAAQEPTEEEDICAHAASVGFMSPLEPIARVRLINIR